MTEKNRNSAKPEPFFEWLCGKIFGHRYQVQELRHYGILDSYGKVYEICSICGKHHFLGWKRSLSDQEYLGTEDDGTGSAQIIPGSILDCAMNCGWWDEDHCICPPGGKCYCNEGEDSDV